MRSLRVLFVIDKMGFLEVLSIPVLSAVAKRAGHQVGLVEFARNPKAAAAALESYRPDIVAYSVCSTEWERYVEINARLKNRAPFFSVFGGSHPTFFPELIEEDLVDCICMGEGDEAFKRFLNSFGTDDMFSVGNFLFQGQDYSIQTNQLLPLISDLDTLPFPDRELIYSKNAFLARSPIKSFFAGRGCPFKCSYCFNHAYHELYRNKGHVVRAKSVSYLLQEIERVRASYPLTFVKFQDDVLGIQRSWLEEFAAKFPNKIELPFMCYARPNMVTNKYAQLLRKAGCYSVCMAIESGNDAIRRSVLNRRMDDERILEASAYLKEQGIKIYAVNMVGLPGETEANISETIALNQKARVDFADASIFQPYPGTRITEYCKETGLLDKGKESFESQFTTSVLNFPQDRKLRIETIHRLFSIMVDHPWVNRIYPTIAGVKFARPFLNLVYRLYYGVFLHRRIYAGQIPLFLQLRGALSLLFSRNRI